MQQYLDLLTHILSNGEDKQDRTGIGTRSVFGYQMRFDLAQGFPAVTTKKLAWKSVVSELLWFLEGSSDERRLAELLYEQPREQLTDKRTIWTANADKQGVDLGYENSSLVKELGPVYGTRWRSWTDNSGKVIDQITQVIENIKQNPDSRRHIVSAWDVGEIDNMALPPCHTLFQFYVCNNKLSCQLYQRSADVPLGIPFNIASYALLTHIIAKLCELEVGEFVHTCGDAHIYHNQIDGVKKQIARRPGELPVLEMPEFSSLDDLLTQKTSSFKLVNYNPQDSIKFPFAT